MSSMMTDDESSSSISPRVNDLMDRLDDLGFPRHTVDQLTNIIDDTTSLDTESSSLTAIFRQIIIDLTAYAHGRIIERPISSTKESIQNDIVTVLRDEYWPYTSIMTRGPTALNDIDVRILALEYLLSELQAAKMIALHQHKSRTNTSTHTLPSTAANAVISSIANATSQLSVSKVETNNNNNNRKKRQGEDDDETEVSASKRPKAGGDASSSSSSTVTNSMEDIPHDIITSATTIFDEASQELSHELHLLANLLHIVLNQTAVDKMMGTNTSSTPLNGVSALRLIHNRLTQWLNESPIHAQSAALSPILRPDEFTPQQLLVLSDIYSTFHADYTMRLHVMRKRVEVTLQSFQWGGKGKMCTDELSRLSVQKLANYPSRAQVDFYEIWCATPNLLSIVRLTSRDYAMRSSIKRVIIGRVPDRGGRVDTNTRIEHEYGMPAFTKRTEPSTGGGGGGGHRRGGGGGGHHHRGGKGKGR